MLVGVVTIKDVLEHAPTVIHDYGWKCLFRCVLCSFNRKPQTFLNISCGCSCSSKNGSK